MATFPQLTDDQIASAAVRALRQDEYVPADWLHVSVSRGWVTLEGEVNWDYQRDEAEDVVRDIPGVAGIRNLIRLRPPARPTPAEQQQMISDRLARDLHLDMKRAAVSVHRDEFEGDHVILRGAVRTLEERRAAEQVAWSAPGVTWVENQLAVGFSDGPRHRHAERSPS